MTMSDGNFAKKLSPIMEDFEEEKLKRWESDESTNVCEEFISRVIWAISIIFIVVTFPFSLCVSIRMVQVRNLKVIILFEPDAKARLTLIINVKDIILPTNSYFLSGTVLQ